MISDGNSFESKFCATSNECVPKGFEGKNKDDDRKKTNYDNWIQPNKCIPITHFFKESKNKVEFEDNNNEHNMLIDDDEI